MKHSHILHFQWYRGFSWFCFRMEFWDWSILNVDVSFTFVLVDKSYSYWLWQRWFNYFSTLANVFSFVIGRNDRNFWYAIFEDVLLNVTSWGKILFTHGCTERCTYLQIRISWRYNIGSVRLCFICAKDPIFFNFSGDIVHVWFQFLLRR